MILLVDLDDVLAGFESGFLKDWRKKYPDQMYIPLEERTVFKIPNQYPADLRPLVDTIYQAPGFYRNLPIITGGKEAITEMKGKGHTVFLCTSPLTEYTHCVLEKYQWVEEKLGLEWTKKIILTKDKTLIHGDYLIDDNPNPKGALDPVWEHIIYDFPYNRDVKDKRRLTWANWNEVLRL